MNFPETKAIKVIQIRPARYIACDSRAHLVSKDGSVISSKSPSPAFSLMKLCIKLSCMCLISWVLCN